MAKLGRPTVMKPETVNKMVERLSAGEPLRRICADKGMPNYATVARHRVADKDFNDLLAQARSDGTHALADECLDIADNPTLEPADKRVRIETRIRLIGKWNSRAYGDKVDVNHGGQKDNPVEVVLRGVKAGESSDD